MYRAHAADIIVGTATASVGTAANFGFLHEITPIIADIAIFAGAFVALHGLARILYDEVSKIFRKKHE